MPLKTIRNQALYRKFLLYTKEAIAVVRADVRKNPVPAISELRWKKDSGGYRLAETQSPIWFACIDRRQAQLGQLASYKELSAALSEDSVISKQVNKTIGTQWNRSIVQRDSVINLVYSS
jgi:hypothetical protein